MARPDTTRTGVSRARLLAYRCAVHDLAAAGTGSAVLDVGLQDYPPGRTARLALRLRTGRTVEPDGTALVHSVRGAMHLHHATDLALFAAALRQEDPRDLAVSSLGQFGADLAEPGFRFDAALDEVGTAMTEVMSDRQPRTKGELSGAVSARIDPRLAPWCEGCGVHHVQDALFRRATLQAGLTIDVESPTLFRFRPPAGALPRLDVETARAAVVRRFLRAFGPAAPADLATWLALTPAAARRWWQLVAPDLVPVPVEGATRHVHPEDLDLLTSPPEPPAGRMLAPYDPLTELADRKLLVPDATQRRQVWHPAANPGVLLVDGEIAGTWRQRTSGRRVKLTLTPFRPLDPARVDALQADARTIAGHAGAADHEVTFDAWRGRGDHAPPRRAR